jgi:hypothetical protein
MYFAVACSYKLCGYHSTELVVNQLFPNFNNLDLYMQYLFMFEVTSAVNYFNFINAIPI